MRIRAAFITARLCPVFTATRLRRGSVLAIEPLLTSVLVPFFLGVDEPLARIAMLTAWTPVATATFS